MKAYNFKLFKWIFVLILLFSLTVYADGSTRYFEGMTYQSNPTFTISFTQTDVEIHELYLFDSDQVDNNYLIADIDDFEKEYVNERSSAEVTLEGESLNDEGDYLLYIPEEGARTKTGIRMNHDIEFHFELNEDLPEFHESFLPLDIDEDVSYVNRRNIIGQVDPNNHVWVSVYESNDFSGESHFGEFYDDSIETNYLLTEGLLTRGFLDDNIITYNVNDHSDQVEKISELGNTLDSNDHVWMKPDMSILINDCNSQGDSEVSDSEFIECVEDHVVEIGNFEIQGDDYLITISDDLVYDEYNIYYENRTDNFLPSGFFNIDLSPNLDEYYFNFYIENDAGNVNQIFNEHKLIYSEYSPELTNRFPDEVYPGEESEIILNFEDDIKINKNSMELNFTEGKDQYYSSSDFSFEENHDGTNLEATLDLGEIIEEGYYEYEIYIEDMAGNALTKVLNFTRNDNIPRRPTLVSDDLVHYEDNIYVTHLEDPDFELHFDHELDDGEEIEILDDDFDAGTSSVTKIDNDNNIFEVNLEFIGSFDEGDSRIFSIDSSYEDGEDNAEFDFEIRLDNQPPRINEDDFAVSSTNFNRFFETIDESNLVNISFSGDIREDKTIDENKEVELLLPTQPGEGFYDLEIIICDPLNCTEQKIDIFYSDSGPQIEFLNPSAFDTWRRSSTLVRLNVSHDFSISEIGYCYPNCDVNEVVFETYNDIKDYVEETIIFDDDINEDVIFYAEDSAGVRNTKTGKLLIDKTPPTTTWDDYSEYNEDSFNFNLNVNTNNGSEIDLTEYCMVEGLNISKDNFSEWEDDCEFKEYDGPIFFDDLGAYNFAFRSIDELGNEEELNIKRAYIDHEKPLIELEPYFPDPYIKEDGIYYTQSNSFDLYYFIESVSLSHIEIYNSSDKLEKNYDFSLISTNVSDYIRSSFYSLDLSSGLNRFYVTAYDETGNQNQEFIEISSYEDDPELVDIKSTSSYFDKSNFELFFFDEEPSFRVLFDGLNVNCDLILGVDERETLEQTKKGDYLYYDLSEYSLESSDTIYFDCNDSLGNEIKPRISTYKSRHPFEIEYYSEDLISDGVFRTTDLNSDGNAELDIEIQKNPDYEESNLNDQIKCSYENPFTKEFSQGRSFSDTITINLESNSKDPRGLYDINITCEDRYGRTETLYLDWLIDTSLDPNLFLLSPIDEYGSKEKEPFELTDPSFNFNLTSNEILSNCEIRDSEGEYDLVDLENINSNEFGKELDFSDYHNEGEVFEFDIDVHCIPTSSPDRIDENFEFIIADESHFSEKPSFELLSDKKAYFGEYEIIAKAYDTDGIEHVNFSVDGDASFEEEYFFEDIDSNEKDFSINMSVESDFELIVDVVDIYGNEESFSFEISHYMNPPEIIRSDYGEGIFDESEKNIVINSDDITLNYDLEQEGRLSTSVYINEDLLYTQTNDSDDIQKSSELYISIPNSFVGQKNIHSLKIIFENIEGDKKVRNYDLISDLKYPNLVDFSPRKTSSISPEIELIFDELAECNYLSYENEDQSFDDIPISIQGENILLNDINHNIEFQSDTEFEITCEDWLGNEGKNKFSISYDTTPIDIEYLDIRGARTINYHQGDDVMNAMAPRDIFYIELSTNKKDSNCRYSLETSNFNDMVEIENTKSEYSFEKKFDGVLDEGEHHIYLECRDSIGNNIARRIDLEVDFDMSVNIIDVQPSGYVNESEPSIKAYTIQNASCSIYDDYGNRLVNFISRLFRTDMAFTHRVLDVYESVFDEGIFELNEGVESNFIMRCEDNLGVLETSEKSFSLILDTTPPEITFDFVDLVTEESTFDVEFSLSKESDINIYSGDSLIKSSENEPAGDKSFELNLRGGENKIYVEAIDAASNSEKVHFGDIYFNISGPRVSYLRPNGGIFQHYDEFIQIYFTQSCSGYNCRVDLESTDIELYEDGELLDDLNKNYEYDNDLINIDVGNLTEEANYTLIVQGYSNDGSPGERRVSEFKIDPDVPLLIVSHIDDITINQDWVNIPGFVESTYDITMIEIFYDGEWYHGEDVIERSPRDQGVINFTATLQDLEPGTNEFILRAHTYDSYAETSVHTVRYDDEPGFVLICPVHQEDCYSHFYEAVSIRGMS